MSTKKPLSKNRDWVEEIFKNIRRGLEGFTKAADLIVEAIDKNPANAEMLYQAAAEVGVPTGFLRNLEAVGRKILEPRFITGRVYRHTAQIRRLRFDLQTQVLDGKKFPFLTADGTPLMIDLRDCEKWQTKQMFAVDHIRTMAEQKSWIEDAKAELKATNTKRAVPWVVTKKTVRFEAGAELTHQQIIQLALQLHK